MRRWQQPLGKLRARPRRARRRLRVRSRKRYQHRKRARCLSPQKIWWRMRSSICPLLTAAMMSPPPPLPPPPPPLSPPAALAYLVGLVQGAARDAPGEAGYGLAWPLAFAAGALAAMILLARRCPARPSSCCGRPLSLPFSRLSDPDSSSPTAKVNGSAKGRTRTRDGALEAVGRRVGHAHVDAKVAGVRQLLPLPPGERRGERQPKV